MGCAERLEIVLGVVAGDREGLPVLHLETRAAGTAGAVRSDVLAAVAGAGEDSIAERERDVTAWPRWERRGRSRNIVWTML